MNCVDLFAGAGGFSYGFRQANFNILGAVDRSEPALKTYQHNLPKIPTVKTDLQETSPSGLLEQVEFTPADVDVVIGGPPCKGFSTAGKMDPGNPKNSLVANYINIVSTLSPDVVVMENVTGILSMEGGEYKERIISALRDDGYNISDKPAVLNAANFGVPQRRERVFFIAGKEEMVDLPSPTHYDPESPASDRPAEATKPWISLNDAIGDLAFLEYGETAQQYRGPPQSEYQSTMREGGSEKPPNHKATNHQQRVRERFRQLAPGESGDDLPEEYQTKKHSLQRWHPDKPAPTVTTLPDDFVHYEQPRIPTVRELARLQSFPDWFEFKGPRTTGGKQRQHTVPQYSQVGNAVPPRLAKKIGETVRTHLQTTVPA
ncbi:DNA cytosine methyltransferase [Halorubrum tropicale]|uniref:DNA (cytosine-5-)-methyltransferase n=1 Tax=Halorubrum tropicale TaxID=1765655 RepID=A0A0M9AQI8_9EURY|nr:DNA cytosine methyltransferase [Halorubrum tropicale]KOX95421.1 hypothetical protein AMR74_14790 [Halorubrum tropicale]